MDLGLDMIGRDSPRCLVGKLGPDAVIGQLLGTAAPRRVSKALGFS